MILQVTFGIVLLLVAGCSPTPMGDPRLKTTPVSGVVHVDGKPEERLVVTAYPESGSSAIKRVSYATTDAQGKFSFGTYKAGDGLPTGTYRLTFKWQSVGQPRKDQLNSAYSEPEDSEHKVTVASSNAKDLGIIELSTKGPNKQSSLNTIPQPTSLEK